MRIKHHWPRRAGPPRLAARDCSLLHRDVFLCTRAPGAPGAPRGPRLLGHCAALGLAPGPLAGAAPAEGAPLTTSARSFLSGNSPAPAFLASYPPSYPPPSGRVRPRVVQNRGRFTLGVRWRGEGLRVSPPRRAVTRLAAKKRETEVAFGVR